MNKEEKNKQIDILIDRISSNGNFYLADTSELNSEVTSNLRRECFNKKIELTVVKNALLKKAMEKIGKPNYESIYPAIKGSTSIMFAEGSSVPAKLIKEFRIKNVKPILKAAYIEDEAYVGDNQLDALATIKSKNELIGEIVALLQSPAKNVISALKSGGNTLGGIVKTLQEKK